MDVYQMIESENVSIDTILNETKRNKNTNGYLEQVLYRHYILPNDEKTKKVAEWFIQEANSDNRFAQFYAYLICVFGRGINEDIPSGLFFLKKSAKSGFIMAINEAKYESTIQDELKNRYDNDMDRAIQTYKDAYSSIEPTIVDKAGYLLEKQKKYAEAKEMYKKADSAFARTRLYYMKGLKKFLPR